MKATPIHDALTTTRKGNHLGFGSGLVSFPDRGPVGKQAIPGQPEEDGGRPEKITGTPQTTGAPRQSPGSGGQDAGQGTE